MKYIVIVPDGMTDEPIEDLDGRTPLEVARTTNLDYLAQNGMSGLVQTIPAGMLPGSDVGNLSVMGYDPKKHLSGRAPLEAASMDIDLKEDEVVFRCNLVTVDDEGKMIDYSAGHIKTKEAGDIIRSLSDQMTIPNGGRFYAGKSYRHLLVLKSRNPKNYCAIKTTPPHDITGQNIEKFLPSGAESRILLSLMEQAHNILKQHPINQVRLDLGENLANMIWLWGQGTKPQLPSFQEKYGVKGGLISAVDLVCGIGKLTGLEIINVPGITGYYDTNFSGKADYALRSLEKNDFVYIHIEAPDEAGHNGDIENKIKSIEQIDSEIVGRILNHFEKHDDFRILVSPDHPTPIRLKTHTANPVNFVMFGKGIDPTGAENCSEASAEEQGLKFKSGEEMMNFFIRKFL